MNIYGEFSRSLLGGVCVLGPDGEQSAYGGRWRHNSSNPGLVMIVACTHTLSDPRSTIHKPETALSHLSVG